MQSNGPLRASGIPVESSGVHWSSLEFTGIRGAGESIAYLGGVKALCKSGNRSTK